MMNEQSRYNSTKTKTLGSPRHESNHTKFTHMPPHIAETTFMAASADCDAGEDVRSTFKVRNQEAGHWHSCPPHYNTDRNSPMP